MLVFSDRKHKKSTSVAIEDLSNFLIALQQSLQSSNGKALEISRDLLIYAGMFESAVCDEIYSYVDSVDDLSRMLRQFLLELGTLHVQIWNYGAGSLDHAVSTFEQLRRFTMPVSAVFSIPEGYAYYGLFPETYIHATQKFMREIEPADAVCIGIRSIGTSLSALVSGTMREKGLDVKSFTARPRGNPFERRIALSEELQARIKEWSGSWYLIVDEGPGLSGSSMTCVAEELKRLGIPASRIIFLPSSNPTGDTFVNQHAKNIWKEHTKYISSFESLYERENQLTLFPGFQAIDFSAGKWRDYVYGSTSTRPAVNLHHERRKYLLIHDSDQFLAKFAGFGFFAKEKVELARELEFTQMTPIFHDFTHGFILYKYLPGVPVQPGEFPVTFIQTVADYLTFRKNLRFKKRDIALDELMKMIRRNIDLGLGEKWISILDECTFPFNELAAQKTCAIDGRMMPHKWILTENGIIKTDAVDHYSDQFIPGFQDIAWDIAGFCVEFNLNGRDLQKLISLYSQKSGDHSILKRLFFYRIAYLSFRLGYSALSATAMKGTSEEIQFCALERWYARRLKRCIAEAFKMNHEVQ